MFRMLKIAVAGVVLCFMASACSPAGDPQKTEAPTKGEIAHKVPALPTQAEAESHFARWKAALATKDPKAVAALFRADAILEPTVSNKIRATPSDVEAYFVDFLKLSPVPTINERYIDVLDENTILDAGVWTFDLTRNGKPEFVTARYSFIWEKEGADWKIQLLHSSLMPEPVKARLPALGQATAAPTAPVATKK